MRPGLLREGRQEIGIEPFGAEVARELLVGDAVRERIELPAGEQARAAVMNKQPEFRLAKPFEARDRLLVGDELSLRVGRAVAIDSCVRLATPSS